MHKANQPVWKKLRFASELLSFKENDLIDVIDVIESLEN